MADTTLLQPCPDSVAISYHPSHAYGDAVSIQFDDPAHGPIVVAFTPETADHIATLLATAVQSPRIHAAADQMRAAQRDRR